MRKRLKEETVRWEIFEKYISSNLIAYEIVEKYCVQNYPVFICRQSPTNFIALLLIPSYKEYLMTADLVKTNKLVKNNLVELMVEAKKRIALEGYDVPLVISLLRVASSPKSNEPVLVLNKSMIF